MIVKEKNSKRLRWATAAMAFVSLGLLSSGCASHNATAGAAPTTPDDRPDAPAAAAAPAAPSPLSKGDQDEMARKQAENKGQAPPP